MTPICKAAGCAKLRLQTLFSNAPYTMDLPIKNHFLLAALDSSNIL